MHLCLAFCLFVTHAPITNSASAYKRRLCHFDVATCTEKYCEIITIRFMHNERNSQPLMSLNIWHMNIDRVQQNSQPLVQHTSVGSLTPIVYCVSLFSLKVLDGCDTWTDFYETIKSSG